MKTSIADHLAYDVIHHMPEQRHAVFRAQNFVLWEQTYGESVTDKINKLCTEHWRKKNWKGVPFHPLLVSLSRNGSLEKQPCPST